MASAATVEDVGLRGEVADLRPGAAQAVVVPANQTRNSRPSPGPDIRARGRRGRRRRRHPGIRPERGPFAPLPPRTSYGVFPATRGKGFLRRPTTFWPVGGTSWARGDEDMVNPDWFFDPVTGTRAPQTDYCFKVNHRSEDVTGNVKQVWELSRMHHLTVLAAAFSLSGDERYATRTASHLRTWWAQNPFLSGVHWTSGIEIGLRLISWAWVRRLLDGWEGAAGLFEDNEVACAQIWWHQHYLASFRSRGSSANNHVIAEASGLLVGALAFDWFTESCRWAEDAAGVLEDELKSNTFPSGVNREMAFDYHGFVAELVVVAAAEASWAGRPLSEDLWTRLYGMFDVIAATADVNVRGATLRRRGQRHGSGSRPAGHRAVVWPPRHRRDSVRRTGMVAESRPDSGKHRSGIDGWPSPLCGSGAPSEPLCRCRPHRSAQFAVRW